MNNREATHLPNVYEVVLVDVGVVKTPGGVYVWPNGWLTMYPSTNVNEGRLVPPWRVEEARFGEAS